MATAATSAYTSAPTVRCDEADQGKGEAQACRASRHHRRGRATQRAGRSLPVTAPSSPCQRRRPGRCRSFVAVGRSGLHRAAQRCDAAGTRGAPRLPRPRPSTMSAFPSATATSSCGRRPDDAATCAFACHRVMHRHRRLLPIAAARGGRSAASVSVSRSRNSAHDHRPSSRRRQRAARRSSRWTAAAAEAAAAWPRRLPPQARSRRRCNTAGLSLLRTPPLPAQQCRSTLFIHTKTRLPLHPHIPSYLCCTFTALLRLLSSCRPASNLPLSCRRRPPPPPQRWRWTTTRSRTATAPHRGREQSTPPR